MLSDILAVLVISYLVVGALIAAVVLLAFSFAGFARNMTGGQLNAVAARLEAERRSTPVGLVRDVVSKLLAGMSVVISWPVDVRAFVRGRQASSRTSIVRTWLGWSDTMRASVCALLAAVIAALCVAAVGRHWYLAVFCWVLIAANLARQLSVALQPLSLAETLRQRIPSPVLQLTYIAMGDFVALTIAALILLRWSHGVSFQTGWLPVQARQILGFHHLSALWEAREVGSAEVLVAIASVAVYTLVLSQLKSPQRLLRRNADRVTIAESLIFGGRLDDAARWLRTAIDSPHKDSDTVTAEGLLAMLQGDLATAFGHARIRAGLRRLVLDESDARDDALSLMVIWAKPFVEDVRGSTLARPNHVSVEEAAFFEQVMHFVLSEGLSDHALAGVLGRPKAVALVDWEFVRRVGITDPPFTLATASLEITSGLPETLDRALGRLRDAKWERHHETLVASTLRGYALLMCARHVSRDATVNQHEALSQELLSESRGWAVETFPTWLRQWLADYAAELQRHAKRLGDRETATAINDLRGILVGKVTATGDFAYLDVGP